MEVQITVYKDSGKFYWKSEEISCEEQIPMYSNRWKLWIAKNCPNIHQGFIVVQSTDNDLNLGNFHSVLYRWNEIFDWNELFV